MNMVMNITWLGPMPGEAKVVQANLAWKARTYQSQLTWISHWLGCI